MNKNILFLMLLIGLDTDAYIKIINKGPYELKFGYIENDVKWQYVKPNKSIIIHTPSVKSFYVDADMRNDEGFVEISKKENIGLSGDNKITITYRGGATPKTAFYYHWPHEDMSKLFDIKRVKIKSDNKSSSSSDDINTASSSAKTNDNKKESRQRENSR